MVVPAGDGRDDVAPPAIPQTPSRFCGCYYGQPALTTRATASFNAPMDRAAEHLFLGARVQGILVGKDASVVDITNWALRFSGAVGMRACAFPTPRCTGFCMIVTPLPVVDAFGARPAARCTG
jgi:hypothetical protein